MHQINCKKILEDLKMYTGDYLVIQENQNKVVWFLKLRRKSFQKKVHSSRGLEMMKRHVGILVWYVNQIPNILSSRVT